MISSQDADDIATRQAAFAAEVDALVSAAAPTPSAVPLHKRSAKEKAELAHALRVRGLQFRQIAVALGVTPARAEKLAAKAQRASLPGKPTVKDADRALQIERLESAMVLAQEAMAAGSLQALQVFAKLEERISKLKGLDAPVLLETKSVVESQITDENLRRIAEAYIGK
jgi:hypothetical protein